MATAVVVFCADVTVTTMLPNDASAGYHFGSVTAEACSVAAILLLNQHISLVATETFFGPQQMHCPIASHDWQCQWMVILWHCGTCGGLQYGNVCWSISTSAGINAAHGDSQFGH